MTEHLARSGVSPDEVEALRRERSIELFGHPGASIPSLTSVGQRNTLSHMSDTSTHISIRLDDETADLLRRLVNHYNKGSEIALATQSHVVRRAIHALAEQVNEKRGGLAK